MTKHRTRSATLQDRLARSLDKANTQTPQAAPPPAKPTQRQCRKVSVSLFAGDLERLDAILDYMAQRGHRLTTSHAVKLALRTVPLSADMDKALDAIRSEDGRGKW